MFQDFWWNSWKQQMNRFDFGIDPKQGQGQTSENDFLLITFFKTDELMIIYTVHGCISIYPYDHPLMNCWGSVVILFLDHLSPRHLFIITRYEPQILLRSSRQEVTRKPSDMLYSDQQLHKHCVSDALCKWNTTFLACGFHSSVSSTVMWWSFDGEKLTGTLLYGATALYIPADLIKSASWRKSQQSDGELRNPSQKRSTQTLYCFSPSPRSVLHMFTLLRYKNMLVRTNQYHIRCQSKVCRKPLILLDLIQYEVKKRVSSRSPWWWLTDRK